MSKFLLTPVDSLVELIEKNPGREVVYFQNILNVPIEVLERWLIILEEFNILDIHYKGFNAFVNLNPKGFKKGKDNSINLDRLKEQFIETSKKRNLNFDKIKVLWPLFISEYEGEIKDLFYQKAKKYGYEEVKIDLAWNKYKLELMEFN